MPGGYGDGLGKTMTQMKGGELDDFHEKLRKLNNQRPLGKPDMGEAAGAPFETDVYLSLVEKELGRPVRDYREYVETLRKLGIQE